MCDAWFWNGWNSSVTSPWASRFRLWNSGIKSGLIAILQSLTALPACYAATAAVLPACGALIALGGVLSDVRVAFVAATGSVALLAALEFQTRNSGAADAKGKGENLATALRSFSAEPAGIFGAVQAMESIQEMAAGTLASTEPSIA
ncbi:MAG: hypothetical protein NXI24_11485 [bacterium]|nr:hypothetical protein [bacterium]